jgi:hypothetical protein
MGELYALSPFKPIFNAKSVQGGGGFWVAVRGEFDKTMEYHFSVPCGLRRPTSFARAAACLFQSAALAY